MRFTEPKLSTSSLRALVKCLLFVAVTFVMFVPVLLLWGLALEGLRAKLVAGVFLC